MGNVSTRADGQDPYYSSVVNGRDIIPGAAAVAIPEWKLQETLLRMPASELRTKLMQQDQLTQQMMKIMQVRGEKLPEELTRARGTSSTSSSRASSIPVNRSAYSQVPQYSQYEDPYLQGSSAYPPGLDSTYGGKKKRATKAKTSPRKSKKGPRSK